MGAKTAIEWTDRTFNIAWGCTKLSPACTHCYAETWAKRTGFDVWGVTAPRRTFGEKHWQEPLKWNKHAEKTGVRQRVFCSSMADVFEDHPIIEQERVKLWPLIKATPWLDWQLLTKRADRILHCLPAYFSRVTYPNVWLGFTAENQEWFDKRAEAILAQPGLWNLPAVWFVSCEPLLGAIDLKLATTWLNQVIVGGESGPNARPMHPDWARSLQRQCQAAGVAFHFKQQGEWGVYDDLRKQGTLTEGVAYPAWPNTGKDAGLLVKIGKKKAGRLLDGRTWNEYPATA